MMSKKALILSKRHPATIFLTWFYAGFSPIAPGTCGSLAAIPFAWMIVSIGGQWTLFITSCFVFFVGWFLCWRSLLGYKEKDPQVIVIDEVVGQWLTLAIVPADILWYFLAFLFFRMADIYKPWPVSLIDRKMKNGLGIMLDDVAAAIYAIVGIQFINLVIGLIG